MADQRKTLGTLLRHLADVVEGSSRRDVEALLREGGRLEIIVPTENGKQKKIENRSADFHKPLSEVSKMLGDLPTREAGLKFLDDERPTKAMLEALARYLDLPVYRTDTIDALREKIVESVIGSRLRSEAIQGRKT